MIYAYTKIAESADSPLFLYICIIHLRVGYKQKKPCCINCDMAFN